MPEPGPEQPEAEVAGVVRLLGEEHLGDVDEPGRDHDDRPGDQDAEQRARVAHDDEALGRARASGRGRSAGRSASSRAGIPSTSSAEMPKVTAFTQYARSGPDAATIAPPTIGPIAVVVHSTSWSSAFAVDEPLLRHEVRQPGEHGRAEERVPDPGERGEEDDHRRGARERAARRTRASRPRSEPIISPLRESRSTSGPASRPRKTAGRMFAISSAPTHQPECVRS